MVSGSQLNGSSACPKESPIATRGALHPYMNTKACATREYQRSKVMRRVIAPANHSADQHVDSSSPHESVISRPVNCSLSPDDFQEDN